MNFNIMKVKCAVPVQPIQVVQVIEGISKVFLELTNKMFDLSNEPCHKLFHCEGLKMAIRT